jgi:hypothetical protein
VHTKRLLQAVHYWMRRLVVVLLAALAPCAVSVLGTNAKPVHTDPWSAGYGWDGAVEAEDAPEAARDGWRRTLAGSGGGGSSSNSNSSSNNSSNSSSRSNSSSDSSSSSATPLRTGVVFNATLAGFNASTFVFSARLAFRRMVANVTGANVSAVALANVRDDAGAAAAVDAAAVTAAAAAALRRLVSTGAAVAAARSVAFGVQIALPSVAAAVSVQAAWEAATPAAVLSILSAQLRAAGVAVPAALALSTTASVFTGAGATAAAAAAALAGGGDGSIVSLIFAWGIGPLMAFYGCFVFELMILYSALKANGLERWMLSFNDPANQEGFSEVQMKALLTIGMGAMTLASVSIKNPGVGLAVMGAAIGDQLAVFVIGWLSPALRGLAECDPLLGGATPDFPQGEWLGCDAELLRGALWLRLFVQGVVVGGAAVAAKKAAGQVMALNPAMMGAEMIAGGLVTLVLLCADATGAAARMELADYQRFKSVDMAQLRFWTFNLVTLAGYRVQRKLVAHRRDKGTWKEQGCKPPPGTEEEEKEGAAAGERGAAAGAEEGGAGGRGMRRKLVAKVKAKVKALVALVKAQVRALVAQAKAKLAEAKAKAKAKAAERKAKAQQKKAKVTPGGADEAAAGGGAAMDPAGGEGADSAEGAAGAEGGAAAATAAAKEPKPPPPVLREPTLSKMMARFDLGLKLVLPLTLLNTLVVRAITGVLAEDVKRLREKAKERLAAAKAKGVKGHVADLKEKISGRLGKGKGKLGVAGVAEATAGEGDDAGLVGAATAVQRLWRRRKAAIVMDWAVRSLVLTVGMPNDHRKRMFGSLSSMTTAEGNAFIALLAGMELEVRRKTLEAAFSA